MTDVIDVPRCGPSRDVYALFGWSYVKRLYTFPGRIARSRYVLKRETDIPHYQEIVSLEKEFFALQKKRKVYIRDDWDEIALLYLALVIPGLIYSIIHLVRKIKFAKNNRYIDEQQDLIIDKVKKLRNLI